MYRIKFEFITVKEYIMFEKVEDKAKEVAGEVQEKYGELTDDYGN